MDNETGFQANGRFVRFGVWYKYRDGIWPLDVINFPQFAFGQYMLIQERIAPMTPCGSPKWRRKWTWSYSPYPSKRLAGNAPTREAARAAVIEAHLGQR